MGTLRARLRADLTQALKARDTARVSTLRLLEAELHNEEIDRKQPELTDEEILRVLEREGKRRREAADAYRAGGRPDRERAELAEAEIIAAYVPPPLPDEELERIIREVIETSGLGAPKDLGKVMGMVMGKVRGRADGERVRVLVSRTIGP